MESIKYSLLEKALEWITGEDSYQMIKKTVDAFMDSDLSGEEKLEKVKGLVYPILQSMSKVLINVAIEVAVAVLKSQIEDTKVSK